MEGFIRYQGLYGSIDDLTPDQGLVPLDIDDDFSLSPLNRFGYPFRPRPKYSDSLCPLPSRPSCSDYWRKTLVSVLPMPAP